MREVPVRATPETEGPILELGSEIVEGFRSSRLPEPQGHSEEAARGTVLSGGSPGVEELRSSGDVERCADVIGRAAEMEVEAAPRERGERR
jgi:hypothetical protein